MWTTANIPARRIRNARGLWPVIKKKKKKISFFLTISNPVCEYSFTLDSPHFDLFIFSIITSFSCCSILFV